MEYLYKFLGWLFGGVEVTEILWPKLDWILFEAIVLGLILTVLWNLGFQWIERNYGSPFLFWYFTVEPTLKNAPLERELYLNEVKQRYDAIYRGK